MDPSQLERWVTAHDSVAGGASGLAARGRRVHPAAAARRQVVRRRLDGRGNRRLRLARWEGEGPAGSRARVSYRLEAEDGGTRLDYHNELALPGGGAPGKLSPAVCSAAAPGKREASRSLGAPAHAARGLMNAAADGAGERGRAWLSSSRRSAPPGVSGTSGPWSAT